MKHSKGEWKVQSYGFLTAAESKDLYAVAKVYTNDKMSEGEAEANKKLISCAPELLEALTNVTTMIRNDSISMVKVNEAIKLIKRATE